MEPKTEKSGITGKARETLAKIIDHVLRDECLLSATTRDYRGKVTGPHLYSLNRLFDEQRRQLDYWLGQVIEQAKAIGIGGRGGIDEAKEAARASTAAGAGLPPRTMIGDLLARHEQMADRLRQDIARLGDPTTTELLNHLLEFHETTAWMLRMLHNGPGSDRAA